MEEEILQFFASLAPFTEEELLEVTGLFQPRILRKREFFCVEGQVSREVAFVQTGLMRSFFIRGDRETTTFFQLPHMIAVALSSFVEQEPAKENIQALANTEIIVLSRQDLYGLYEENWKWQQVGRVLIESYYVQQEQRLLMHQSLSAQERYAGFSEKHPEILRQAPLHCIASYLGISPETLSRIRGGLSNVV